jgi:hypothetical protein
VDKKRKRREKGTVEKGDEEEGDGEAGDGEAGDEEEGDSGSEIGSIDESAMQVAQQRDDCGAVEEED